MAVTNEADWDIERSWATEPLLYKAPHPEQVAPREYQYAGAEYALSRRNSLIGDVPGLGKSCQSILVSNAMEAKRTLVLCPASLRLNWEREIWKWSMLDNVSTYPVLTAKDGISPKADYLIMSYDLLRNDSLRAAIMAERWDHLILDEGHYLKDPKKNKRINALFEILGVVGKITMLSGTITPNQPIECLNTFKILDHSALDYMTEEDFRQSYYDIGEGFVTGRYQTRSKSGELVWKIGPHWSTHVRNVPVNIEDLRYRLRSKLMVRRLKEQVLPELPPATWHPFPISLDPKLREVMRHPGWEQAEKLWEMDPDAFDPTSMFDGAIATAWRELGEAKAPAVAAYAEELMMEGCQKIVIGAWNHSVLDILMEKLGKYGATYMDGRTSPKKKQAAVDDFNDDPAITFIIGQTKPLGEGWNLVSSQDVILAQPVPTPGVNYQLLDRISRIGQEGMYTLGHLPIVPNSLDERWIARAVEKDITIHQMLDVRD